MSDTSSKNANLARVRDNQRRSRARRKEYLSELETKYQNCERVGVEANAEIQAAAKLVLADNKRLRAMLKALGVSDADVDRNSQNPGAARTLEGMLSSRRACGGGAASTVSSTSTEGARLSPNVAIQARSTASSDVTPQRSLDSPDFEASSRWADGSSRVHAHATGLNQIVRQQQQHHQQPLLQPRPSLKPTPPQQQQEEQLDPPAFEELNRWSDGSRIHAMGMAQLLGEQQQPLNTHMNTNFTMNIQPQTRPIYALPEDPTYIQIGTGSCGGVRNHSSCIPAPSNSKSCHEVADTIRMMRPDVGDVLEAELGCRGDGGDCDVSNLQAFDVLDRWSDGGRVFAMGLPGGS